MATYTARKGAGATGASPRRAIMLWRNGTVAPQHGCQLFECVFDIQERGEKSMASVRLEVRLRQHAGNQVLRFVAVGQCTQPAG